jgi:Tol biopolymer transport system component
LRAGAGRVRLAAGVALVAALAATAVALWPARPDPLGPTAPSPDAARLVDLGAYAGRLRADRLARTTELERQVALSPDASFVVAAAREGDLARIAVGSGRREPLTQTPDEESQPAVAPDALRVAFVRGTGDARAVWLMQSSGGGERLLVEAAFAPAWFPDGAEIAYARRDREAGFAIVRRRLQGGTERVVAEHSFEPSSLAVDPGGVRLAISDGTRVLVVDAAGGTPRPIADTTLARGVTWSATGDALFADAAWRGRPGLWRLPVDGGSPIRLAAAGSDARSPSLSRDGARLAYVSEERRSSARRGRPGGPWTPIELGRDVRCLDVDRSGRRAVVTDLAEPDGKTLVLVELAGRTRTPLGRGACASFSPDSTRIAFTRLEDATASLWVMPATGGAAEPLGDAGRDAGPELVERRVEWSADGRGARLGRADAGAPSGIASPHASDRLLDARALPDGSWIALDESTQADPWMLLLAAETP